MTKEQRKGNIDDETFIYSFILDFMEIKPTFNKSEKQTRDSHRRWLEIKEDKWKPRTQTDTLVK